MKFICDSMECSKVFANRKAFKEHRRVHTKEEPYRCMLCDKRFKWRSSLRSHRKMHSNVESDEIESVDPATLIAKQERDSFGQADTVESGDLKSLAFLDSGEDSLAMSEESERSFYAPPIVTYGIIDDI